MCSSDLLAGVVRAHVAAGELDMDRRWSLVCGARLRLQDAPPMVVWVPDREGYAALCRLLTLGRRRAPKGECHLWWRDVAELGETLLAGVLLHRMLPPGEMSRGSHDEHMSLLGLFAETFGDFVSVLGRL